MLGDFAQIDRAVDPRRKHVGPVRPVDVQLDGFGPYRQPNRCARRREITRGGRPDAGGGFHVHAVLAHGAHAAFHERGFTDELRDEPRFRPSVDVLRRPHLQQVPLVEDRQPVGDGQGLFLVVGDVDRGQTGLFADAPDFRPHFKPQFGVEIGQRLVEQQALGLDDQRAGQRDALLLAAGELVGLGVRAVGQFDHFQRAAHAGRGIGFPDGAHFETEGDVFAQGHVRPQRVALEHHAHVAPVRRQMRHVALPGEDAAAVGLVQPRHGPQQRGLSAPGRPQQEKQFAGIDLQIDAVQHRFRPEPLGQFLDRDGYRHGRDSLLRFPF